MEDDQRPPAARVARSIIESTVGRPAGILELTERSIELARVMLALSDQNSTSRDREQAQVLGRMIKDRKGQAFTTLLTDRVYRSRSLKRAVEQARHLLERIGPPEYLGPFERFSLGALRSMGGWVPTLSGTAMLNRIEAETSAFVLPADGSLDLYLKRRRAEGTGVNINRLGEEVLGESEAEKRLQGSVELLSRPGIEALSVKVSSIDSQLSVFAFDASVRRISERLQILYRAALRNRREDGRPKLVTLDMEAYRDARLVLAAFKDALEQPEFLELTAGIALQAYLPDTVGWHQDLLQWSRRRRDRGGAPIRTRLVKGANLALERVESDLRGWENPVYPNKLDVDANFKRLLFTACHPENLEVAHLGVGSHNLFDVCLALLLRVQREAGAGISFEFLEGMAEPLRRSLEQLGASTLIYAPIVGEEEFPSALAYLVRRLDENTAPENYLAQSFSMRADSEAWQDQVERFVRSCRHLERVSSVPRRQQNRSLIEAGIALASPFVNEADTDFSLPQNRRVFEEWLSKIEASQTQVASVIEGRKLASERRVDGFDPSRPNHVPYQVCLASAEDIERALACAKRVQHAPLPPREVRQEWLFAASQALRRARPELVSMMVLDAGKRVEEADVEVSEAIDFAEYYLRCQRQLEEDSSVRVQPRGPVVVAPPWNFPLAIPIGGVFAALVAGNPVIIKPALETPWVVQRGCELLWEAGVPQNFLQLVVCEDREASMLIRDARTRAVVLTGATSTAELFLQMRSDLVLFAETGGKNAMFVSAISDHEQAVLDIVTSAFGHAGQKCSALSQLILDRELYTDPSFLRMLADATRSLRVGSAWDPTSFVTPLIQPPNQLQLRALTQLEPGERWLVEPLIDRDNPRLVSPGIKLGVQPGSFAHRTEFFCPMLSVLSARGVGEAVEIANRTSYGLTAGIHGLDEREQAIFIEEIQAGNVYVNRRITGAVVRRQAFGGWKRSSFGPGAKAGGPNYVAQFNQLGSREQAPDPSRDELRLAGGELPGPVQSVLDALDRVLPSEEGQAMRRLAVRFSRVQTEQFVSGFDESQLLGEDNVFRYRPINGFLLVVTGQTSVSDIAITAVAAATAETSLELVAVACEVPPSSAVGALARALGAKFAADQDELIRHLEDTSAERIRCGGVPSEAVRRVANRRNLHLVTGTPLTAPRWELLNYHREQSVSVLFHRYGHLGLRK